MNDINKTEKNDGSPQEKNFYCIAVKVSMTKFLQLNEGKIKIEPRSDGTIAITLRGVTIVISDPKEMQKLIDIFEVQQILREARLAQEKNINYNKTIEEQKIPDKLVNY